MISVALAGVAFGVGMIILVVTLFAGYTVGQLVARPVRRKRWRRARIADFQVAVEQFTANGGTVRVWPDDDPYDQTLTPGGQEDD